MALTPRRKVMRYLWGRTTPATAADIAAKTGLDSRQVGSVIRPLIVQGFVQAFDETPKAYQANGAVTYRDAR